MRLPILLFGAAICMALAGCANLATPYQRHDGSLFSFGGYYDKQVGEDKFEVAFYGNQFTSAETVNEYCIKRILEVCRDKGFRDYIVINSTISLPYHKPLNFHTYSGLIQCIK